MPKWLTITLASTTAVATTAAVAVPLLVASIARDRATTALENFIIMGDHDDISLTGRKQIKVVSMGDSVTAGYNTFTHKDKLSYADYMVRNLRVNNLVSEYHNFAESGSTIPEMGQRMIEDISVANVLINADLVTFSIGGNDILRFMQIGSKENGAPLSAIMGHSFKQNNPSRGVLDGGLSDHSQGGHGDVAAKHVTKDTLVGLLKIIRDNTDGNGDDNLANLLEINEKFLSADYISSKKSKMFDIIKRGVAVLMGNLRKVNNHAVVRFVVPPSPFASWPQNLRETPMKKLGGMSLDGLYKEFTRIVSNSIKRTADHGHIKYADVLVADDVFDKTAPTTVAELVKRTSITTDSGTKITKFLGSGKINKAGNQKWTEKDFIRNMMIPTSADIHPSNVGYEIMGEYLFKDISKKMGRTDDERAKTIEYIHQSKESLLNDYHKAYWEAIKDSDFRHLVTTTWITEHNDKTVKLDAFDALGDLSGKVYKTQADIDAISDPVVRAHAIMGPNYVLVDPEFFFVLFENKYEAARAKFRASHNDRNPTYKELLVLNILTPAQKKLRKLAYLVKFNSVNDGQNDIFASDVDSKALGAGSLSTIPLNEIVDAIMYEGNKEIINVVMNELKIGTLEELYPLISKLKSDKLLDVLTDEVSGKEIAKVITGILLAVHNFNLSKGKDANNDVFNKSLHLINGVLTPVKVTGNKDTDKATILALVNNLPTPTMATMVNIPPANLKTVFSMLFNGSTINNGFETIVTPPTTLSMLSLPNNLKLKDFLINVFGFQAKQFVADATQEIISVRIPTTQEATNWGTVDAAKKVKFDFENKKHINIWIEEQGKQLFNTIHEMVMNVGLATFAESSGKTVAQMKAAIATDKTMHTNVFNNGKITLASVVSMISTMGGSGSGSVLSILSLDKIPAVLAPVIKDVLLVIIQDVTSPENELFRGIMDDFLGTPLLSRLSSILNSGLKDITPTDAKALASFFPTTLTKDTASDYEKVINVLLHGAKRAYASSASVVKAKKVYDDAAANAKQMALDKYMLATGTLFADTLFRSRILVGNTPYAIIDGRSYKAIGLIIHEGLVNLATDVSAAGLANWKIIEDNLAKDIIGLIGVARLAGLVISDAKLLEITTLLGLNQVASADAKKWLPNLLKTLVTKGISTTGIPEKELLSTQLSKLISLVIGVLA